jgi:alkylated DNA repair dioxygenase AlkB
MLFMQPSLFPVESLALPQGLCFMPEFLSEAEEATLLRTISDLTLTEARYKQYTARRRVAAFGGKFDYDTNELRAAPPIPSSLMPLRNRVAAGLHADPTQFAQMLVAEYRPGTALGWHRDVPDFESIVGISLGGSARMRFRAYPPLKPGAPGAVVQLDLPPRSVYVMEGAARWKWQHSIVATTELRYSISLRTMRASASLLPLHRR